jgi:hypothetical protein
MATLTLTAELEPVEGGQIQARLVELPAVITFAPTREAAIDALVDALQEYCSPRRPPRHLVAKASRCASRSRDAQASDTRSPCPPRRSASGRAPPCPPAPWRERVTHVEPAARAGSVAVSAPCGVAICRRRHVADRARRRRTSALGRRLSASFRVAGTLSASVRPVSRGRADAMSCRDAVDGRASRDAADSPMW